MTNRLVKHFVSILGGQFFTLLTTILLPRIFLKHWSVVEYGEWVTLSSVAVALANLDLGMNSAVGNRMLAAYTKGDMKDYVRCQHSAMAFYFCLALAATILTALVFPFLPLKHLFNLPLTSARSAAAIVWLLGLQILWVMPVGLLGNTYRTIGQPAKTQWITNGRYAAFAVITALVLILGGDMFTLAFCQFMPMLLVAGYLWWDLSRKHRELLPGLSQARWDVARELLKPSLMFAVIMAANAAATQGSIWIVAGGLGVVAVAVFGTTRTMCNAAMQIVRTINNAAWPDVTILHAQGETERLRTMHRLLISLSTCLCIVVAAALWFLGPQLIAVWLHGKLKPDLWFVRWMLIYLVLQSPWLASSTFMIAINKHHAVARAYVISSGLGLTAAAFLVHRLGLSGIPIGLIIGEAASCYYFVVDSSCRVLGERTAAFLARVWLGLGAVAGLALGAGRLAERAALGPDLARWLEICTVTTVTALLVTWTLWLTPLEERAILARRIGPVRARLGF